MGEGGGRGVFCYWDNCTPYLDETTWFGRISNGRNARLRKVKMYRYSYFGHGQR